MDGNRRFAERENFDTASGHRQGYQKMVEVIHWCIELGVKYISVYAFSIDNFQRSPQEVSTLMHLAEDKYAELSKDNGLAEREGIEMHIVGDLTLPPPSVQGAAARLMQGTAQMRNKHATLNICFSYTSTEELVNAIDQLQSAVGSGLLPPSGVTPATLHGSLHTQRCPPVDLLLRTSGETRLSDFMLWQVAHAHMGFVDTLWPDLSFLDFAKCILSYQRHNAQRQRLAALAAERLARHDPGVAPAGCCRAGGAGAAGGGCNRSGGVGFGSSIAAPQDVWCRAEPAGCVGASQPAERPPAGAACLGNGLGHTPLSQDQQQRQQQGQDGDCIGAEGRACSLGTCEAGSCCCSGQHAAIKQAPSGGEFKRQVLLQRQQQQQESASMAAYYNSLERAKHEWISSHVHL